MRVKPCGEDRVRGVENGLERAVEKTVEVCGVVGSGLLFVRTVVWLFSLLFVLSTGVIGPSQLLLSGGWLCVVH